MSVTFFNTHFNIVYADISTGEISIKKALRENEVLDIIESILPSEIILPKTQEYEFILKTNKKNLVTFIDNKYLEIESASNYFEKTYRFDKKLSLTNFSIDEKISLGAIIKYIAFTQNEKTPVMLFPQRNKIDDELKDLFTNSERQVTGKVEHFLDKNSFTDNIIYWTSNHQNDLVSLTCYDWSDATEYEDQLRIEAYTDEYYKWLVSLE